MKKIKDILLVTAATLALSVLITGVANNVVAGYFLEENQTHESIDTFKDTKEIVGWDELKEGLTELKDTIKEALED